MNDKHYLWRTYAVARTLGKIFLLALVIAIFMVFAGEKDTARAAEKAVSGTLVVDGKKIDLVYAYVDRVDPSEPIIVLSNKPLPAEAIPFIPEKLVKEQKIYAVAFSVSQKDRKLTNNYGMLSNPGDSSQVGLGRVEEGRINLTISRLDENVIEGKVMTAEPVKLSYISYSFDLSFKAGEGKGR